jgi:hypothetical protein
MAVKSASNGLFSSGFVAKRLRTNEDVYVDKAVAHLMKENCFRANSVVIDGVHFTGLVDLMPSVNMEEVERRADMATKVALADAERYDILIRQRQCAVKWVHWREAQTRAEWKAAQEPGGADGAPLARPPANFSLRAVAPGPVNIPPSDQQVPH